MKDCSRKEKNEYTQHRINNKFLDARRLGGFRIEGIIESRGQQELLFLNGDCESLGLSILLSR